MLDTEEMTAGVPVGIDTTTYDLVVIGTGICGLNALYAATQYLDQGAQVLILDQKQAPGGMWTQVYDYVRLHQPHPMFTVGDLDWGWRKPPEYLAARDEVQGHLAASVTAARARFRLTEGFGMTVTGFEEVLSSDGPRARVTFHPNDAPGAARTLTARRVIHAQGLSYTVPEPLALSSGAVVSTVPNDLLAVLKAHPGAPVYVIGGGKTGMDTILAALKEDPTRAVHLLNGKGTNFVNRNRYLPTGMGRWTGGKLLSRVFHDIGTRFDGTNEVEVREHLRRTYATDPETANEQFLYGMMSEEELTAIKAGLSSLQGAYLADVVDTPGGPQMQLRGGGTLHMEPGSIVVNCTGNIFRGAAPSDPVPILSPQGTILSINARDALHFLSSVGGFFCAHLYFRGLLRGSGLYIIDLEALFRKDRDAWVAASAAQAYHNQVMMLRLLPLSLLDKCHLDMDRWYPLPRRMFGLLQAKMGARRTLPHCAAALDRVAERFDVHCVPLSAGVRHG